MVHRTAAAAMRASLESCPQQYMMFWEDTR